MRAKNALIYEDGFMISLTPSSTHPKPFFTVNRMLIIKCKFSTTLLLTILSGYPLLLEYLVILLLRISGSYYTFVIRFPHL